MFLVCSFRNLRQSLDLLDWLSFSLIFSVSVGFFVVVVLVVGFFFFPSYCPCVFVCCLYFTFWESSLSLFPKSLLNIYFRNHILISKTSFLFFPFKIASCSCFKGMISSHILLRILFTDFFSSSLLFPELPLFPLEPIFLFVWLFHSCCNLNQLSGDPWISVPV